MVDAKACPVDDVRGCRKRTAGQPLSCVCVCAFSFFLWEQHKGPFRTKNATALNSVVFCYCRSVSLSVAMCCLLSLYEKK